MAKLTRALDYLLSRPSFLLRPWLPYIGFHGIMVPTAGPHMTLPVWKRIWRGTYEAPEIKGILGLLRPGDRVLELGCGMGVVSGVAAKSIADLTIESYEANAGMLPAIADLHAKNGLTNITVHNAILLPTDTPTTRRFHFADSFAEGSIIAHATDGGHADVPVHDIRKVLSTFKPQAIICDIEGAEEELFSGTSLKGVRAVIIELHPDRIPRSAVKDIYDRCAAADLYPVVELSTATVVAFEKVDQ